jgi:serine/threonine-protein kinase RsbW
MQKKKFIASLDHLYDMLAFVRHFALQQGFDDILSDKIMLATEEALVNIIRHGYAGDDNKGEVEISCEKCQSKPGMKILIKDQGVPFDPIQKAHEKRQKTTPQEELGGYGILIYVGLMDQVEYYRTEEGNLLFLIKYLD